MQLKAKKYIIYTVICGNYDVLRPPEVVCDEFDYVCFSDQKFKETGVWETRPLVRKFKNTVLANRYHKMHPHILFPEYDYSIYLDGNIQITGTHLFNRAKELAQSGEFLSLVNHPFRQCVYEEIIACARCKRDSIFRLRDHLSFLKEEQYPHHNGLFEANLIFRRHNSEKIIQTMEQWWFLFSKYSRRDQLSLPYVLWKKDLSPTPFFNNKGQNVRNCEGYFHFPHKARKKKRLEDILLRLISLFAPAKSWRIKIRYLGIIKCI